MRRAAFLGVLLAATSAVAEPTPGPDPAFTPPRAERSELPNGLHVLAVRRPGLPLVTMVLVVPGAGSAADPRGKGGLAAYTADLLDEGAGGKGAMELAGAFEQLGASLAIDADADSAVIQVTTLSSTLPAAVELLGSILATPAFDDKEAERVRADRLTQAQLRRDRPRDLADDLLAGALFGDGAAHGHPVDGDAASVARLTSADARAFFARAWHPAAATLVVAGDVDPQHLPLAPLAAWTRKGRPPAAPAVKPLASPSRLRLVDRPGAEQSDVSLGLASPGREDPRSYAWETALNAFAGGFTGRLTQRLREQLGYLYHVYPDLHLHRRGGAYSVRAALVTPHTADGMREIVTLGDDLATRPMAETELRKARQNLIRALPERFEDNGGTARTFAELTLEGLSDDWYAGYAAGVAAVTAETAQAAARALLQGRLVFVVVGDMAKVRAGVEKLGLGRPATFDLDGKARR